MFRPLKGHHQVVHLKKRAEGCTVYNVTSHCILYSPQPFVLDVQPDDGLLEAETQYGPVLRRGYVLEYLFANRIVVK